MTDMNSTAKKEKRVILLRKSSIDDLDFIIDALASGEGYTKEEDRTNQNEERVKICRYLDENYNFGPNEIDNCPKFTYLAIDDKTQKRVGFILFTVRDFNTPGFQDFGIFDKIDRSLFPKDGRFCEIFDLWIDSDYRRQGIATQLKLKAEEIATIYNLKMVYTHTEEDNPHVIELNRKLGYKIIRTGVLWDEVIRVSLIKWI